jgi:hypothetical protein
VTFTSNVQESFILHENSKSGIEMNTLPRASVGKQVSIIGLKHGISGTVLKMTTVSELCGLN